MKKVFLKAVAVMLTFVILSLPTFSNFTSAEEIEAPKFDTNKVLETRFLNMLNHSFVYGEDFAVLEEIVNNSVVALLDKRDTVDDSYIDENIVNGYLYDMYGFKIVDFSKINPQFDYKEGYVYILPRGFAIYEHSAVCITENKDGTYTFVTDVNIKTHDSCEENLTAKTIFVKNPDSVFGYNIVISEIY
ncbi:MAG: hypothetical protein IJO62_02350 [Clostridia bacterium]|nr:hypothetical protein [Clostridia bacterium]